MDELFEGGTLEQRGDFEEPSEEDGAAVAEGPGIAQANRVFDVLDERLDLLGDHWPFEVIDDALTLKSGAEPRSSPYVALLAITLAHAHKMEIDVDPKQVLEAAVAETLGSRGLKAVDVGAVSREEGDFRATVMRCGVAVGLQPTPHDAVTLAHANEEGVDSLAHLPWGDGRPGAWTFLGQATCGKSDRWNAKIAEPKPAAWKQMLSVGILPLPFLAVPHHVEMSHMAKLVQDNGSLVLDRIRLSRYRESVSSDEARIIDAVLSVGVEQMA